MIASSPGSSVGSVSDLASIASSDSDELVFPPSPPVHKIALKSVHSSQSTDYFGSAKATFLAKVFPRSKALRQIVDVADPSNNWSLALFQDAQTGKRTIYAQSKLGDEMTLRQDLVELLDHAAEELACDDLVVVLDKKDTMLAERLHSLLYVGGVVVAPDSKHAHGKPSLRHVLVGIEL